MIVQDERESKEGRHPNSIGCWQLCKPIAGRPIDELWMKVSNKLEACWVLLNKHNGWQNDFDINVRFEVLDPEKTFLVIRD